MKRVAWHPDGEVLVSCSYDDSIKLWMDCDDEWICVQTLSGVTNYALCMLILHTSNVNIFANAGI